MREKSVTQCRFQRPLPLPVPTHTHIDHCHACGIQRGQNRFIKAQKELFGAFQSYTERLMKSDGFCKELYDKLIAMNYATLTQERI